MVKLRINNVLGVVSGHSKILYVLGVILGQYIVKVQVQDTPNLNWSGSNFLEMRLKEVTKIKCVK